MTDPTPKAAPMRKDATQADREAAASLIEQLAPFLRDEFSWLLSAETMRRGHRGKVEHVFVADAFTRHRLTHTARPDAGEAITNAADILDQYAGYIATVKADELERHPYLPSVEQASHDLHAALSRPYAGDADVDLIERGVRAAYVESPHTVISQALAEATGMPLGATIDYDTAIKTGMDALGLRRIVTAAFGTVRERSVKAPTNGEPDPAWAAIKRAIDQFVGRVPSIGKHRALNNAHLAALVERLDAAGDKEAADTIVWQCWWRALDRERERFLLADAEERLAAVSALGPAA